MKNHLIPGQLVIPKRWVAETELTLYEYPGVRYPTRTIGRLGISDVAVVIAIEDQDWIYVLGPRGGGWTLAAMFIVKQQTFN